MTPELEAKVAAAKARIAAERALTLMRAQAQVPETVAPEVQPIEPIEPTSVAPIVVAASLAPAAVKPQTTVVFDRKGMASSLLSLPTMMDVGDLEREHVCLYGPPKTGKTLAAGILAEFYNVLWFDGDKGLKAIYDNLPPELLKRIIPFKVLDTPDTPMYVRTMLKVVTGRKITMCTDHGIVDCPMCKKEGKNMPTFALNQLPDNWVVVMDSQTQFVTSAGRQITQQLFPGKEAPLDFKFERDQWGSLKNIMDNLGNYIKDLNCNFIGISHETMVETEVPGVKTLAAVAGSDNSSKTFARNYGTVVFTRVVNGKHTYNSATTFAGNIQTGSRSGIALEDQEIPALLHLFRPKDAATLLKGSWTEWFYKHGGKKPKPGEKIPTAPLAKNVLEATE